MTDLERELLDLIQAVLDLDAVKKANAKRQLDDYEAENEERRRLAHEMERLLAQTALTRRNPD
jgi:hypothetical protein